MAVSWQYRGSICDDVCGYVPIPELYEAVPLLLLRIADINKDINEDINEDRR